MVKAKTDDLDIEIKANLKDAEKWKKWSKNKKNSGGGNNSGGALYFVGFIGSFIYWIQAAVGFGAIITGFLKSLVWPAYIVYNLLVSFYGAVS